MRTLTPRPTLAPRPGSADWLLEHEYLDHRDAVIGSVRKQLYGRAITLDPSDLEATYNSAWHVLHQKLSAGEQIANRQGLLVMIMVRRILSDRRTLAGSNPTVPLEALDGPPIADHAPELPQQVGDRERVRQLLEGFRERLSGRELQAATLCYLHGHTRPEAARLLGVPPKRMEKLMDRVSREISGVVRDVEDGWCHANRSLVTAYALGVLATSGPRHQLAQSHLTHCASCRRRVLVMRGMAAISPPAPLLVPGGGVAVVAGTVGGGAALAVGAGGSVGAGIAGIAGALTGAAALVGSAVVLGGGIGSAAPLDSEPVEARAPARAVAAPMPWTVVPSGAGSGLRRTPEAAGRPPAIDERHGVPASTDPPAGGPAAGGPPGPVTPLSPERRATVSPSAGGGAVEPGARRAPASDGTGASATAAGATSDTDADTGVTGDGRRYASAEATASGPSAEATSGAAAGAPGSAAAAHAQAAGESASPVDVGTRARAEAGGEDPHYAYGGSEAWAIGGADEATLSTASTARASGRDHGAAHATANVAGSSARSLSVSEVESDRDEGTATGASTARSGPTPAVDPEIHRIPLSKELAASFRWSSTLAFFDAATQQQVQLDLSWLLADLPGPGMTLAFATVGGSGLDSYSLALAYGAGASTIAAVTLSGGEARATASPGDGRGWSIALATVDGTRATAAGLARGEGDGHTSHEALVGAVATRAGTATALSSTTVGDPHQDRGPDADRQSVEAATLAQIARRLVPSLPGTSLPDALAPGDEATAEAVRTGTEPAGEASPPEGPAASTRLDPRTPGSDEPSGALSTGTPASDAPAAPAPSGDEPPPPANRKPAGGPTTASGEEPSADAGTQPDAPLAAEPAPASPPGDAEEPGRSDGAAPDLDTSER